MQKLQLGRTVAVCEAFRRGAETALAAARRAMGTGMSAHQALYQAENHIEEVVRREQYGLRLLDEQAEKWQEVQ